MLKNEEQSWGSFCVETTILIIIVLIIRFYGFQFFRVSGPSMCPTLNHLDEKCVSGKGEFIFVNEFLYYFLNTPKRGEVVIFNPPGESVYYVKRVIGVPGDEVSINRGRVYRKTPGSKKQFLEESYLSPHNQGRTHSQIKTFVVPEDSYLLFGDNRTQSLDARKCFRDCQIEETPFVKRENIKGKAEFVIWPFWKIRWIEKNDI